MGMTLFESRSRYPDELRLLIHLFKAPTSTITHRGAQTAYHLIDDLVQHAAIGHAPLYALVLHLDDDLTTAI